MQEENLKKKQSMIYLEKALHMYEVRAGWFKKEYSYNSDKRTLGN